MSTGTEFNPRREPTDNPSNNQTEPDQWTGVNGRLWRWTIGRGDYLLQTAFNLGALFVQAIKMIVEVVSLPARYVTYAINKAADEELKTSPYPSKVDKNEEADVLSPFDELALDGITFIVIGKLIGQCSGTTLVAPGPHDQELSAGVRVTIDLFKGGLHKLHQRAPVEWSISRLFNRLVLGVGR